MARIRSLKPGFCTSEDIAELSIPCRLHFAMLWTYADDYGRGLDNPRLIKAACWPLDDDIDSSQVEKWQTELEEHGRIVRYEDGDRNVFQVVNWEKHQKPQHPKDSEIAPPPERPHEVLSTCHEESPEKAPVVVVGGGVVVGEGDGAPQAACTFDDFWSVYPLKTGKRAAAKAWASAIKRAPPARIVAGARRYAYDPNREQAYTKHAQGWLNADRWDDEPLPPRRSNTKTPPAWSNIEAAGRSTA